MTSTTNMCFNNVHYYKYMHRRPHVIEFNANIYTYMSSNFTKASRLFGTIPVNLLKLRSLPNPKKKKKRSKKSIKGILIINLKVVGVAFEEGELECGGEGNRNRIFTAFAVVENGKCLQEFFQRDYNPSASCHIYKLTSILEEVFLIGSRSNIIASYKNTSMTYNLDKFVIFSKWGNSELSPFKSLILLQKNASWIMINYQKQLC